MIPIAIPEATLFYGVIDFTGIEIGVKTCSTYKKRQ